MMSMRYGDPVSWKERCHYLPRALIFEASADIPQLSQLIGTLPQSGLGIVMKRFSFVARRTERLSIN